MRPFAYVVFDGERLSADPRAPGRRLRLDPRCLAGPPVPGAFAHVCALPDRGAALRFDEPEVQQARRDALAWWVTLLGDDLVCLTTLALDASPLRRRYDRRPQTGPLWGRSLRPPFPGHGRGDGPLQRRGPAVWPGNRATGGRALAWRAI